MEEDAYFYRMDAESNARWYQREYIGHADRERILTALRAYREAAPWPSHQVGGEPRTYHSDEPAEYDRLIEKFSS